MIIKTSSTDGSARAVKTQFIAVARERTGLPRQCIKL